MTTFGSSASPTNFSFAAANSGLISARWHNRRLLLLKLLESQPISRIRLARSTGLSTTTVTNLTSEMVQDGVVAEIGVDTVAQSKGAGRPPVALHLVADSRYAVGVHIGVRSVRIVLCNLMARELDRAEFDFDAAQPPHAVIAEIVDAVQRLLARNPSADDPTRLIGVGVGASGLVDWATGVNLLAPTLGWRNLPLRDLLANALRKPVVVDNNVRYMALGESMYGAGRSVRALAFVYARVGLAAGLVVDGKIYRGAGYGAGEIGHWIMTPTLDLSTSSSTSSSTDSSTRPLTLEDLLSERTLVAIAGEVAPDVIDGIAPHSHAAVAAILDAARAGNVAVQAMLVERARYLGVALANLVDVLNPEMLLLGGYLAEGFDLFEPILTATMRQHAFAGLADKVTLHPATFGEQAGAIGAAAGAFNHLFFGATTPAKPNID